MQLIVHFYFSEQFFLVTFSLKCLCLTTLADNNNLFVLQKVSKTFQWK